MYKFVVNHLMLCQVMLHINHVRLVCYKSSDFHLRKIYITILNQLHADGRPVCTWFLEITYMQICMCVLSIPEAINN